MKLRQIIPVLIITAGFAAYHNSFQGPFIFDDTASILENPHIRHLRPIGDALLPSSRTLIGGHPVVSLSLALNYAMGGLAVWGYHAVNLAIHILAALTLYGILRRTFQQPVLRAHFGTSAERIALAATLIWTVDPLQTEAVTYVSQRGESLMGLFYLLTLYGFVRGAGSSRQALWFALAALACALGMATKEVMVTAPLMVLLYDRTFLSGSFRKAWSRHRPLYLGLAATWLLLGYLMAGSRNLLDRGVGYGLGITWWNYALAECPAVVRYLRLAVWPHSLIFDYGEYVPMSLTAVAPYALILATMAIAVLFALRRQPTAGFVGAWFFAILAPTSSVVPIAGSPMAEHRMYLSLAAVATLAAVGVFEIGKQLFARRHGLLLECVVGGFVVVLFTSLTIQRNQDYLSALTIWRDTVAKCPNSARAHNNLGLALADAGKVQDATEHWEQALRLKPDFAEAHNNLGATLREQGKLRQAIDQYEQALQIKPDYVQAQYNWGNALLRANKPQEAIEHFELAVRIDPDYVPARNNLAAALMGQGRLSEAISHLEQIVRLTPDVAMAHYNLGLASEQAGQLQQAIEHYEQALRINPDFVQAQSALARLETRQ